MESKIRPLSLLEYISSIFSAVLFLITYIVGWFIPNSGYILFFSGLLLIIVLFLRASKNKKTSNIANKLLIPSSIFCIASCIAFFYYRHNVHTDKKQQQLCDITEEAIDIAINNKMDWFELENAIYEYEKEIKYCLIPTQRKISTDFYISKNTPSPAHYSISRWVDKGSRYDLLIINKNYLKKDIDNKILTLLPNDINLTVCGFLYLQEANWNLAEKYLKDAFDSGNGVASYYLYLMYKNGCGMKPDDIVAMQFLKKAAKMGYRKAQTEYGQYLVNTSTSRREISQGISLLKKASMMVDYRSGLIVINQCKAINYLLDYYWNTNQLKESYRFSSLLMKDKNEEEIVIIWHLDNCIANGKYKEAEEIIRKGMRNGTRKPQLATYCYETEAKILSQGLGRKKVDLKRAEKMLRYASDSLDSRYSRKMLGELYGQYHYTEDSIFWTKLYDINFSKNIKE